MRWSARTYGSSVDEVAELEVTNFSPARTAGLVGLTAFGVVLLVAIPVVAAGLALGATP
jgi:hypothetical protein